MSDYIFVPDGPKNCTKVKSYKFVCDWRFLIMKFGFCHIVFAHKKLKQKFVVHDSLTKLLLGAKNVIKCSIILCSQVMGVQ